MLFLTNIYILTLYENVFLKYGLLNLHKNQQYVHKVCEKPTSLFLKAFFMPPNLLHDFKQETLKCVGKTVPRAFLVATWDCKCEFGL